MNLACASSCPKSDRHSPVREASIGPVPDSLLSSTVIMSFQDIEAGYSRPAGGPSMPRSTEDAAFLGLQSSLSLQVFKMNANVQGISKLVDQLGTTKDSDKLRKSL